MPTEKMQSPVEVLWLSAQFVPSPRETVPDLDQTGPRLIAGVLYMSAGETDQHRRRRRRMGKKEREDEPTKGLEKAVKAVDKPSKKEKRRLDKIIKRLPKSEKI
jgi:hypothetical protein